MKGSYNIYYKNILERLRLVWIGVLIGFCIVIYGVINEIPEFFLLGLLPIYLFMAFDMMDKKS